MADRAPRPSLNSSGSNISLMAQQLQGKKTVCLGSKHRRWLIKVKAVTGMRKQTSNDSKAQASEGSLLEDDGDDSAETPLEAEWKAQMRRIKQMTISEAAQEGHGADMERKTSNGIKPSTVGKESGLRVEL
eukprot:CAMPEP_0176060680 /NCGR_PEP_ID=MMETSP0120_2-20121206/30247_1 /TAXON_ID=160619 /ORGANISM="Kryptoperidinium foliaceum, Strain CCMP 1326" /LENGTH=130 /DNA_ID=CAMNT_0017394227 /DNA_START=87 /DNA_END=479 /DNA_ORIENTATION=-